MNNAVFGKTMGNLRNHRHITLVNCKRKLTRLPSKILFFKKTTIFCEDMIAIERAKVESVVNKPVFVGFNILDISKILMYNFHFGFIK